MVTIWRMGYLLGAESGIGSSYYEKPYHEYYWQFPAHNTVMVDSISKYPEMLSNHPFDSLGCYPASGEIEGYYPGLSYSEIYFSRLPEGEYVAYWDYDAPNIPHEPRNASAAAIVASALLELSELEDDFVRSTRYADAAETMLVELSTDRY